MFHHETKTHTEILRNLGSSELVRKPMPANIQKFIEIWVKIACEIDFGREISVKFCEIWAQMNEIFRRNLGACGAQFLFRANDGPGAKLTHPSIHAGAWHAAGLDARLACRDAVRSAARKDKSRKGVRTFVHT